ncbi:MAG: glycogen synthase [Anaerolineae bacterium]|nr:glycogen synthase [Anaerolineae bacterium]
MNVLFVSAEAVPFAKTGGLADVVGSLPKALRQQGIDARVIMPFYGFLDYHRYNLSHLFSFQFSRPVGTADVHVHTTIYDGVPFYFIQAWPHFGIENEVYGGWDWDVPRFLFLSQIAMAVAWELKVRTGWFPDIFHVHDWHTGLLPFLVEISRGDPNWTHVGTMLTIHNMAYQGEYVGGWCYRLGIPGRQQPDLLYQDKTDNLLAMSIAYADIVTTVSPHYAVEIQYPHMGYGLDGLIRTRLSDLHGILNGIDYESVNPDTDPAIAVNYNADNFAERRPHNKRELQTNVHLPVRDDVMVIGLVSRLEWQKGIDLILPALHRMLGDSDVQFVGLGSGSPHYNYEMARMAERFPWRAHMHIGYHGELAQRIYAGCDLFLMPSYFEPCGIGQMIAMRYGALPLVRETGGLADTVANYDAGPADVGTGFVFNWTETDALYNTLRWAMDTFQQRRDAWQRMQARSMQTDFSWAKSARQYIDLYEQLNQRREIGT